ncbi:lysophospholipase L1-like esterase [Rhodococcus percolatus]|uniref:SGNH/GDSL hydrolase family protein n=1 Tax=Rhodococcus opacus TaxID=37919 RepID=UPI0015FB8CE6|nr:SGNH/GDSL hydrolase family protein [Rhodococcus opacus]MBA8964749.1 lysophospholipase L1-like esterase [Rhodococcus opacus]MBP2208301.1 lysophospholipase L1-like esterase [Rhodococcus opacus]
MTAPFGSYVHAGTDQPTILKRPADGILKVLYSGDSLTHGLFASSDAAGFRPRMTGEFEKTGTVDWLKTGASGGITSSVAFNTLGYGHHLAIIELGTNDVGPTSLTQFRTDYSALMDEITTRSPGVQFICAGTWRPTSSDFDAIIEEECLERGGRYRPLQDLFNDSTNRGPAGLPMYGGTSDTFHPNDKGYAAIADRLLEVIAIRN